jgi:hypothetical protein
MPSRKGVALMHRILSTSVVVVLVSLALVAPAGASGAGSPVVFVRIEGAGSTLLPQTLIQTTSASSLRRQSCSGSSAAGALNLATRGQWTGKWFSSFKDFEVASILGETPAGADDFWTLWINGRSSMTGACSTPLHTGDHELWFDCVSSSSGTCANNPLALSAPSTAHAGRPLTVTVTQLDGAGNSKPFAGAAINGGGVVAVSGPGGRATFIPRAAGVLRLHAVKSGATPSDTEFVCVYPRRASQCGSVGNNGPRTHVLGIREHQVFIAHGPRLLHGTAGPDPTGITDVRLSLFRHAPNSRCSYYDGSTGTWQRRGCRAATPAASFSVGASTSWSYLLPQPLPLGSYRLNVIASDSGGRHTKLVPGRSGIDFAVRP